MAVRPWTPADLPSDFQLVWYHFPDRSTVTLDESNKIASIENKFATGSNPATSVVSSKRQSLTKVNGYDTATGVKGDRGITVSNINPFPTGNADRFMMFVVLNNGEGGTIGGYKHDNGGSNWWLDSDFYLSGSSNTNLNGGSAPKNVLNVHIVNHKAGISTLRLNGVQKASGAVTITGATPANQSIGVKGPQSDFFTVGGSTLACMYGKRAATNDEMYRLEAWYSTFTGQAIAADNPYKNSPPTYDDGVSGPTPINGTSSTVFSPITGTSEGKLVLKGNLASLLADLLSSAASTLKGTGVVNATLDPVLSVNAGVSPIKATSEPSFAILAMESSAKLLNKAAVEYELQGLEGYISSSFRLSASLDYQLMQLGLTSIATLKNNGAVRANLDPMFGAANGNLKISGSASLFADALTAVSSAAVKIKANGSATLDSMWAQGTANKGQRVDLNAYLEPLSANSASKSYIKAAANALLAEMYMASDADLEIIGTVGTLLGELVSEANAKLKVKGVSANTLAALFGDINADTDRSSIVTDGSLSVSFEPVTMEAISKLRVLGNVELSLNALTGVYTGSVVVDGISDTLMAPITLTAASKTTIHAATSFTLEPLGVGSLGVIKIKGNANVTFGDATVDATVQRVTRGNLLSTLSGLELIATGVPVRVIIMVPATRVARSTSISRVAVVPVEKRVALSR